MAWIDILAETADLISKATSTHKKYSLIQGSLSRVLSVAPSTPSGASILRSLRAQGIGIRTQQFYRLYNSALDLQEYKQAQAGSFSSERPTLAEIPEGSITQRRQFTYQFRIEVFDYSVGGWRMKPFRYSTNTLLSSADAYVQFQEQFGQDLLNDGANLESAQFDWVKKRPERPF